MSENDSIPPPPTPPENRVECSSCGYIAPKTEYYTVHGKSCKVGIFLSSTIVIAVVILFSMIIIAKLLS